MELFDSHCHIQSVGQDARGEAMTRGLWAKAGEATPEGVIRRAHEADVTRMVCVGCDADDSRLAVEFVRDRAGLWASAGIHPHEAGRYADDTAGRRAFAQLLAAPKVVAVGECGLDYFYTHSSKEAQIELLKFQIERALEAGLPMIFHVREAFDDFWPVFEAYHSAARPIRGVLHSFTDSQANLGRALGHGLFIGVNGIATFTKKPEQQVIYRTIPLDRLVLETDAPFLTPNPHRATICEPYHIRIIAEFLAGQRDVAVATLARATTGNATQLFGV